MKKILSMVLALSILFSFAVPCSASAISDNDWDGVNVSPVNPFERPDPFGTSAPDTSYNLHTNGVYSFHGSADWSRL